jgi:surface polysaccharide O-acyltransferase-like enzyme
MLLPVFQVLFETLRIQLGIRIYLFMFWLVVTCVPVYWPLPLLSLLHQSSLFGFGGYFLMGGVIASLPRDRIPTIVWAFIFVASVLATFGITWYLSWKNNAPIETSYIYYSPNVAISAISAFVLFTRATLTVSMAKTMKWLGERVFLLFFVHVVVLEFVRYSNFISTVSQHSPMLITILIISILTFVISLIIASLIRFVPGAQRVFG